MYKGKRIARFIDKVNKEAAAAAQKVYDKYEPELLRMIQGQLHPDDVLTVGMGTASIDRNGKDIETFYGQRRDFISPIAQTQYANEDHIANFNLPYTITKTTTKD